MKEETGQKLTEELPYVFDLLWDIKNRRRLYESLTTHLGEAESQLDSMCDMKVEITEVEALNLDVIIEGLIRTYKRYKGE